MRSFSLRCEKEVLPLIAARYPPKLGQPGERSARESQLAMQPGCMRALLFHRRSLRLFRVCLSVALLLEQLDLLLTGDLYAWIIDGGGVLDRHVLA